MPRLDYLGPLRERNFAFLFLARTASLLGSAMAPVALAFAVLDDLEGSPSDLGLVLAAASVPQVLFLLVGGVWADRLPRNRILVGSDLVMFATQAFVAALLLTHSAEIWHLAALQAIRGTASAFFFPASTGIVPDTVSAPRLQSANALLRLTVSSSQVLGAALGGLLVAAVGPGYALAFDAATFLASAALLSAIRLAPTARVQMRNFARELREGWDEFWSRTWLWVIVVAACVSNAAANGSFSVLGPVVAERALGGAAGWGLILAAFAAGFVAGGVAMLRFRPQRPLYAACAALFLWVPVFPLLALEAPVYAIATAAFVAGFGLEIFGVLWDTALQQHIPSDRLSRVSAYDHLGSFVFIPIGLALAGPLAERIGVSQALWGAAAVTLVSVVAQLAVADIRNLRRTDVTPTPSPASAGG